MSEKLCTRGDIGVWGSGVFLYVETLTSTCKHVHQLRMHDKAIFDYTKFGTLYF